MDSVGLASVQSPHNVSVIEFADGSHLTQESLNRPATRDAARAERLQRHDPVQLYMTGLENRSHSTMARLL
jgi:hypothetical protein